ncbi:pectin lyase-like protein [Infundibulicybe gibba]|nr:pectin lyase-like protein [Infundibulicybe gibba]
MGWGVSAWNTFVVPHAPGQVDDTPALLAALPKFSTNATILFREGVTYNIFTPVKFPALNNVEVRIEGNLTYPKDIATVQAIVGSSSFPGAWFSFTGGNNVTLRGSLDPRWGWVDGHGQAWWDANQQPVAWNFATSGSSNLHAFNNKIVAVSDTNSFPFNTDGFSAGGKNMLFENNHVQNGTTVSPDSYCEGGHGLSIGSLGKGGQVSDVQDVLMENVVMNNTLYGARFKSWTGGNGLARNITWRNIRFLDVPFPIYVTQNYWDQGVGPRPNTTSTNNTHIQDFLFEDFTGVIRDEPYVEGSCVTDPCIYPQEVVVLDLYPGTATNVLAKNIVGRTQTGAPAAAMCDPTTVTNDVGFKCWDGLFIPTRAGI